MQKIHIVQKFYSFQLSVIFSQNSTDSRKDKENLRMFHVDRSFEIPLQKNLRSVDLCSYREMGKME